MYFAPCKLKRSQIFLERKGMDCCQMSVSKDLIQSIMECLKLDKLNFEQTSGMLSKKLAALEILVFGPSLDNASVLHDESIIMLLAMQVCMPLLHDLSMRRSENTNLRAKWKARDLVIADVTQLSDDSNDQTDPRLAKTCNDLLLRCFTSSTAALQSVFKQCIESIIAIYNDEVTDTSAMLDSVSASKGSAETTAENLRPVTMTKELAFHLLSVIYSKELSNSSENSFPNQTFVTMDTELFDIVVQILQKSPSLVPDFMPLVRTLCTAGKRNDSASKRQEEMFRLSLEVFKAENNCVVPLALLCWLNDIFLPNSNSPGFDAKRTEIFWKVIQQGLLDVDPLTRKRAIFILKQALNSIMEANIEESLLFDETNNYPIVWWQEKYTSLLKKIWEYFFLLVEALEETQSHIVIPVLGSFNELTKAVIWKVEEIGHEQIHVSWLATVLKKAFQHESKVIVRWAVTSSLNLTLPALVLLIKHNPDFISEWLFQSLQHEFLYTRDNSLGKGEPPLIVKDLIQFFEHCRSIPSSSGKSFLQQVIKTTCQRNLNGVPLLCISLALRDVGGEGLVTDELFDVIKTTLSCCISTFPVKIRRGVCHCFAELVFRSMDFLTVPPVSVASFMSSLRDLQHMDYCDTLWNSCIIWTAKYCPDWIKAPVDLSCSDLEAAIHFLDSLMARMVGDIHNLWKSEAVESSSRSALLVLWTVNLFTLTIDTRFDLQEYERETLFRYCKETYFASLIDAVKRLNTNPYISSQTVQHILIIMINLYTHISRHQENCEAQGTTKNDAWRAKKALNTFLLGVFDATYKGVLNFIQGTLSLLVANDCELEIVPLCLNLQVLISRIIMVQNPEEAAIKTHTRRSLDICTNFLTQVTVLKNGLVFRYVFDFMVFVIHNICTGNVEGREGAEKVFQSIAGISLTTYDNAKSDEQVVREQSSLSISATISNFWEIVQCFLQMNLLSFANQEADSAVDIGASSEVFLQNCTLVSLAVSVTETFTFVTSRDIIPLLKCLNKIQPHLCQADIAVMISVLEATWGLFIEQNRRDTSYWILLKYFSSIFLHPCLLKHQGTLEKAKCFWVELAKIGDEKGGVFNAVVDTITREWTGLHWQVNSETWSAFIDLFVDAVIFGQLYRKNLVVLRHAKEFVSNYICNEFDEEDRRQDFLVRIQMINYFCSFDSDDVGENLIPVLIAKLMDKDKDLSLQHKRYFGDSLVHRQKIRLWQAILVLMGSSLPSLPSSGSHLISALFEALYFDNQPSVRQQIEWVTVLAFLKHPEQIKALWEKMAQGGESRIGILTSLISIVLHLGKTLQDGDLYAFTDTAISQLLRWTQVQHMQVKLHAQVVLDYFWSLCQSHRWDDLRGKYQAIQHCFALTDANSSIVKHRKELAASFFLSSFNCRLHYSLETIFSKFLQLSGIADDEWINISAFDFWTSAYPPKTDSLEVGCRLNSDASEADKNTDANFFSCKDVQKKISPWKVLPPIHDPLFQDAYSNLRKESHSELLLCASLIDRTPNLGGLCRTCEIFGVHTLVLGSLKHINDSTFKSLSVSSERWVDIEQVVPRKLPAYLQEKKQEGYRVVAVEQTAGSQSLENYTFTPKTLLLLGNEKEGIPVDIIQLVDDCVEIPQQGIIRSLNVHVSGALAIWEYNRQVILRKQKRAESLEKEKSGRPSNSSLKQ